MLDTPLMLWELSMTSRDTGPCWRCWPGFRPCSRISCGLCVQLDCLGCHGTPAAARTTPVPARPGTTGAWEALEQVIIGNTIIFSLHSKHPADLRLSACSNLSRVIHPTSNPSGKPKWPHAGLRRGASAECLNAPLQVPSRRSATDTMSEPSRLECESVLLDGWVVVRGMGELGGTVEYLYWSTRKTNRFLEDNDLVVRAVTRTVTSPSLSWLPTFSKSN